jgi:hypothetical protein
MGQTVGHAVAEPDVRDAHTNLRLTVDRPWIEDEEHLVKGRVLVRAPRYPAYMNGGELEVEGKLETPPVFDDSSHHDYLARRTKCRQVGWPQSRLLSRDGAAPPYRALPAFRA